MARRVVSANDLLYTVSPLEPPVAGNRHCALFTATLVDETTGRAPLAPVTVSLIQPLATGAIAQIIPPGQLVVTGKPRHVFVPSLATTANLLLRIQAPAFLDRELTVSFACGLRTLAAPGAGNILTLNSSAALVAGQRLLVSTPDGGRVEFATVQTLGPGANQVTLAQTLNSPFPAASPLQPLPPDLTVELHRVPTSIAGRILKRTGAVAQPVAGATVRISKLWRQAPPAGTTVGPELPVPGGPVPVNPWDPPIAAIRPPCYSDFATTASVEFEDRPIDATMPAKTLLDDVPPGATTVRFSDALAMAVNDVIAIDADDEGRAEIFEVANIELSCTPGDWATITLSQPLALPHVAGRVVRRLGAPGGGGLVRALNYPAVSGDLALLFDTSAITGTHQVRVIEPGPPSVRSYHRLDILTATTDTNGFYRLPPLTRAGKVEVAAVDTLAPLPKPHAEVEIVPDYTLNLTNLDVLVS